MTPDCRASLIPRLRPTARAECGSSIALSTLLHLGGRDISGLALLEPLVAGNLGLQFNGHETGDGELILKHAGKLGFEGVVSKTIDAHYAPGDRGL